MEAAQATAHLNNPNVISPYGTQTVTYNGNDPTVTQTFSPEQQKLYEQQTAVKQALGGLGLQGADALKAILGRNLDLSGMPQAPGSYDNVRQNVIDAMMGRANKGFAQREDDVRSQLIAQGIRPGTEAYSREMTRIDQARNDARQQADIAGGAEAQRAYGMDAERRRTAIAELLSQRQVPLNEITALMSGSQVNNPFSQAQVYQGGANVAPAPMTLPFEARMNQYNAQAGNYGNMMSGLFGLGSAGITGYFGG